MKFEFEDWQADRPSEPFVGSWECKCGAVNYGPARSTVPTELWVRCSYCHDEACIVPLPLGKQENAE